METLVERIEALRWRITNQRELSELDSILSDVRELVEAAKEFAECDGYQAHDRLSAVLRKVGGE